MAARKVTLRRITLEELESSPARVARIWRELSLYPAGTTIAALESADAGAYQQLGRLVRLGWVERLRGRGTKADPSVYLARTDGRESQLSDRGERLGAARRRLTRLAKKAHDARYTAISGKMAAALMDIEKEAVEIREQIYLQ